MSIERVGVVGSGIMGSGIAQVAAQNGCEVVLRSRKQETADATVAGMEKVLDRAVDKGRMEQADRDATVARVTTTSAIHDLAECDLVIESVVEDLEVKKRLFVELNAACRDDAIIATNTSTLAVIELAVEVNHPERVCGVHFFNPAPAMKLVEIVRPLTASEETIAAARGFVEDCGKDAVEVKDRAGFIVNALLFPYLNNAVKMFQKGVASREDIDTAMKGGCNFPMGPFELLDLVGLDTSVSILNALYQETRDHNYAPDPALLRMVAAGHLGRKSGNGFYDYGK
jgi:3-hydroxybutyryl-CoA dehydrogenase